MSAIISLTTIPSRIDKIEPCIDSLVSQGLPVHLWVPEYVERTGKELGDIPKFLLTSKVNITFVEDCGPITKLLPALKREYDTIITADDDRIYGKGWADGLIQYSNKYKNSAISYRGRILNDDNYFHSTLIGKVDKPTKVDLVTGTFGALYKKEFFSDSIFEEWKEWDMNDDLVISAHLKKRNIDIIVVPRNCKLRHLQVSKVNQLFAENKRLNNKGMRKLGLVLND